MVAELEIRSWRNAQKSVQEKCWGTIISALREKSGDDAKEPLSGLEIGLERA